MTISFLLAAIAAIVLYLIVWGMTSDVDAAKTAAAFSMTSLPGISSWLEHWEAKKSSLPGQKMAIRSLEGFSISFPILVAVGVIIAVAIVQIGAFISGIIVDMINLGTGAQRLSGSPRYTAAGIANIPIVLIGAYLLGSWIGSRCARNGIFAVILVAALGAIASKSLDFLGMPSEEFHTLFGESLASVFPFVLGLFGFFAISGLLGFWRGSRLQKTKYINYLLSALPEDTRNLLVDLAFEEAKKIADNRRANPA
jgi:hypothetical protein